jgi:hypothetical protein
MPSITQLANRTLQKLGAQSRLTSIDQDIKTARVLKDAYDQVRRREQRANVWNYTKLRVGLPPEATIPAFGFTKQYVIPSDCLRILQVGNTRVDLSSLDYRSGGEKQFAIENNRILTDLASPLYILYCADVTDTSKWDACFDDVFCNRWAIETVESIAQSTTKKESLKDDYRKSIYEARVANAIENPPEAIASGSWELARL